MRTVTMQQVPLDRVTQTIYARIHAAMTPLRKQLVVVQETGEIIASAFIKFQESLPPLDLAAYNVMREQLGEVADALHEAGRRPLSQETRALAAQLVDHDLPRLAAIAVKLNQEDAPKFFAAFNYTDSTFETFAVDAKQKTTIRKADFDAAVDQIVNRRLSEIARIIKADTAQWLASQGAIEKPAHLDLCRKTPNQAFLYWKSLEADLADSPSLGAENERKVREMCDGFREWFDDQGHWRDLKPDAKELDPTNRIAHAKHKKQMDAFVAERQARVRVIDCDDVKTAHKCHHEGTEHERVDYHWTYLLGGEPQVIMSMEMGNGVPPHNDSIKRDYFKASAPCGYAILEKGDRIEGTAFFPSGEHFPFIPHFETRFYPDAFAKAGDYELRKVVKNANTVKAAEKALAPVVEQFKKATLLATPPDKRKWWQNVRAVYDRQPERLEIDKWRAVAKIVLTGAIEGNKKPVKELRTDYLTPRMLKTLLAKLNASGARRAAIEADYAETLRRSVTREEQKAAKL